MAFENAKVALRGAFTYGGGGWTSFNAYPRQLADVNGDGKADIVGFGGGDVVEVSLGKSDGTFEPYKVALRGRFTRGTNWTSFDQYPRYVADVDGDGRADIVAFGSSGVEVALGQDNGTFGSPKLSSSLTQRFAWSSFDKNPRYVADVSGDGRADIVGFGPEDYSIYIMLGQSDGTFNGALSTSQFFIHERITQGFTSFDKTPRQLADVDGDGRADVIAFSPSGVYVALSDPSRTAGFSVPRLAFEGFTADKGGWTSFDEFPRQVADVNNDGRADIVGFGHTIQVALGQKDGTFKAVSEEYKGFTTTHGGWTSFDKYPRQLSRWP